MKTIAILLLLISSAKAERVIMEGKPSTLGAITVSSTSASVAVGTLTAAGYITSASSVNASGFFGSASGLTGTAASLTAGNVTTNATMTGDVTSAGNAVTVRGANGTAYSGLATGILKNTTGTGVPSIAVAGDFPTLNQNTSGTAASATANVLKAGDTMTGRLTAPDYTATYGISAATAAITYVQASSMTATDSIIIRQGGVNAYPFLVGVSSFVVRSDGNIGSGTDSATRDLVLYRTSGDTSILLQNTANGANIETYLTGKDANGSATTWRYGMNLSNSNAGWELYGPSGTAIWASSTTKNVGIGRVTATEKLHVAGTIMSDYGISAATATFSSSIDASSITTSGDARFNGNVGIGGAPSGKFKVYDSGSAYMSFSGGTLEVSDGTQTGAIVAQAASGEKVAGLSVNAANGKGLTMRGGTTLGDIAQAAYYDGSQYRSAWEFSRTVGFSTITFMKSGGMVGIGKAASAVGATLDVNGNAAFSSGITASSVTVKAGAGTARGTVCSTLYQTFATTATLANTAEQILYTYTLPANTLSTDGDSVEVVAWSTMTATNQAKVLKINFGGTRVSGAATTTTRTALQASAKIGRIGASSHHSMGWNDPGGGNSNIENLTITNDETAAITITVTGSSAAGLAGDVTGNGVKITYCPAP